MKNENITHEYISYRQYHYSLVFRLSNYFVLLSMRVFDWITGIDFPDACYYILIFAVIGYDVTKYANKVKENLKK